MGIAAAAALFAAVVAAIGAPPPPSTGAVGSEAATTLAGLPLNWASAVSLAAGFLAAASAYFGRHVLDGQAEAKWIAARAAAEATQSECYRYAARVAPYAGDNHTAAEAFDHITRGIADSARAKGAVDLGEGLPNPDRPPPPAGMTASWYREYRLEPQKKWYLSRAKEHRDRAEQLRGLALAFALLAAALGIVGALDGLRFLTAFVGAVTTIAAAFAAHGALERLGQLAGTYAGMADAIGSLLGRHDEELLTDAQLIEEGETLLAAEYRAWADRMARPAKKEEGAS
ncbi:DUF4231 domain-containing protein [Azospirillum brasilense]|uniref:DUF4231 domain-containing protein n=1 Tax=Azospirillum brasilense TaxID=192 RepID=UPI001EDAC64A|nr:DUF4231 domain-containing protein [Azospirillum brasilense]UKJ76867.1 DUF4231 domain-containing protein [Azospirillum brasilense]